MTAATFSGVLVGTKGSIPIFEQVRIFLVFDFLLTNTYSEKVNTFGNADSSSHYRFEFGGQYAYAPNLSLQGSFQAMSNKASFSGVTKEEQFKDVSVKVGSIFTF